MTVEHSIRRRAAQARLFAALWLSVAVLVLVGTYVSLPFVAGKTLDAITKIEGDAAGFNNVNKEGSAAEKKSFLTLHLFALTTLVLGVAAVSVASFLLGRAAFMEMESAERLRAIA